MMLALTEPLVGTAPPSEQDRLFLTRSIYKESVRRPQRNRTEVIEHSVLRRAILRFTERANCRIELWNAAHPDKPREPIASFAPALFAARWQPNITARQAATFLRRNRS